MNLESVTAELRPRGQWEAADFGARLVRRDAATIYRVWFAATLPLAALTVLAIAYGPYPTLAMIAYWWLEPVVDGPMLHVISRRLFGETPSARAALRAAPALAWRNRIFLISPYRFHIARSIAMPLTQLEGMTGKARRARARVVGEKIMRYGTGVTVVYQHLVLSLYGGLVLLGFALVPPEFRDTLGSDWLALFWASEGRGAAIAGFLAGYVAQSALQPWFVGAGFGLYVNCRTELEAWDLEIAFRRMVERRAVRMAAAAVVAITVLTPMLALPGTAWGQQQGDEAEAVPEDGIAWYWSDDDVRPALEAIAASDELKLTREVEIWRRKNQPEPKDVPADEGLLRAFLASLGGLLGAAAEVALWVGVGAVLLAAIIAVARWRPSSARLEANVPKKRIVLAGGEITAETLPADVPGAALELWRAGERRQAMSVLYRGSVFAAVHRYGVRLPPSATEGMCITAVVQQAGGAPAELFRKIVAAWTWCAYAARDPDDDFVARVCAEWPRHFGTSA